MKATKLIEFLEKEIEKHGNNIEVFVEFPGMNYEDIFSTTDEYDNLIHVDNLSKYDKNLIYEIHGENDGLINGIIFIGKKLVDYCG
jgi:hypothetical protein